MVAILHNAGPPNFGPPYGMPPHVPFPPPHPPYMQFAPSNPMPISPEILNIAKQIVKETVKNYMEEIGKPGMVMGGNMIKLLVHLLSVERKEKHCYSWEVVLVVALVLFLTKSLHKDWLWISFGLDIQRWDR